MLAVGSMPAAGSGGAGGRLSYKEIFSYTIGEMDGMIGRLNLQAFLPLRARLLERFPAAAQLSDMQLLLLLTCATQPMPVTPVEGCNDFFGDPNPLNAVAEHYAHVERMPGHPQGPPGTPNPPKSSWLTSTGVPGGLEVDNSCTPYGYRYVDGLPINIKLTRASRAYLTSTLALVQQYHLGHGR